MLGDIRLGAKRYKEAVRLYELAITEDAQNASAYSGLGAARLGTGDAAGAVNACKSAVAFEPDSAKHHRALGNAYAQLGDSAAAMSAYKTFLDKGGTSSEVAQTVGAYEFRHRRFEDAAAVLARVKGKRSQSFDHLRCSLIKQ